MVGVMSLDRRTFMRAGGVLAAGSIAAVAGCSRDRQTNSSTSNSRVKLPAYLPYHGVRPDLPGNAAGLQDGFLSYPANPKKATTEKPGRGGSFSVFTTLYRALPPALGRNTYWRALNDRLGSELKLTMSPADQYDQRLASLIAGNDLPDLMQIAGTQPHLPQLLQAKFADLSEFVSGDAIKDYPFLANLRHPTWSATVYNGGIYGVPIPREATGRIMLRRDDIFQAKGVDPDPKTYQEFVDVMVALKDDRHSKWALGDVDNAVIFVQQMLGGPNAWSVEKGKFTSAYEGDAYRKALSDVASLVKRGLFHPDAFTETINTSQLLGAGTVAMHMDNYSAWPGIVTVYGKIDPSFEMGGMLPPGYDANTKPVVFSGNPSFSLTAFKKAPKARIKELLSICNWLAAPFGTEEYLFRLYGVPGVDYHMDKADPIPTDKGTAETSMSLRYIADAPWPIYQPGQPDVARTDYEYSAQAIKLAIPNPSIGLYSDTEATDGSKLSKMISDMQTEVLQGRKSLSDWDDTVKKWRESGGDKIKREYEESYRQMH